MQEIIFKIRHFERGLPKSLKKLTFFFLSNKVPFNGNKFKNIPVFVLYYLTKFDDVM